MTLEGRVMRRERESNRVDMINKGMKERERLTSSMDIMSCSNRALSSSGLGLASSIVGSTSHMFTGSPSLYTEKHSYPMNTHTLKHNHSHE